MTEMRRVTALFDNKWILTATCVGLLAVMALLLIKIIWDILH